MPTRVIFSGTKIQGIPKRSFNRKIIKTINKAIYDDNNKKERLDKVKNRLKEKIRQREKLVYA